MVYTVYSPSGKLSLVPPAAGDAGDIEEGSCMLDAAAVTEQQSALFATRNDRSLI